MSDGPHKSLPLRPRWRVVAERAFKPAFPVKEICEAMEAALLKDSRMELTPFIRRVASITEGKDLLTRLPEFVQPQLLALRNDPSISLLAASVIECIAMSLQQGLQGREAILDGVETALRERAAANLRTTEEHYFVTAGRREVVDIRGRLSETMASMDISGFFSRIACSVAGDTTVSVSRSPRVHDGLDEGVPL